MGVILCGIATRIWSVDRGPKGRKLGEDWGARGVVERSKVVKSGC